MSDQQFSNRAVQRRVKRSGSFYFLPVLLLLVALALLVWEVVRANLPPHVLVDLIFAPKTLGIGPAATLVAGLSALLLARTQYAHVSRPYISGHSQGWTGPRRRRAWSLHVHNVGAGVARVRQVKYAFNASVLGAPIWVTAAEARDILRKAGLSVGIDFSLQEVSTGYALKPAMSASDGLQLVTVSKRTADRVRMFAVQIHFEDQLGDHYVWERNLATLFHLEHD